MLVVKIFSTEVMPSMHACATLIGRSVQLPLTGGFWRDALLN